jgi:hypothetical protein
MLYIYIHTSISDPNPLQQFGGRTTENISRIKYASKSSPESMTSDATAGKIMLMKYDIPQTSVCNRAH